MKWSNIREEEYYHMLSMIAIKNDSETLRALVSTVSQPIITLCILPYVSLFCIAVKEYYESCNAGFAISNESPFQVPDIRSKLKLFSDSYSRLEKQILKVDAIQDGEFKNRICFPMFGCQRQYYNIGVFFDSDGRIIGNTQYIYYMFQDKKLSKGVISEKGAKELGVALGTVVASVCAGLRDFLPDCKANIMNKQYTMLFQDYNTNKDFNFFPSNKDNKELSLRTLHLLCSVNFIRFVLNEIVPLENIWNFRAKYITMYYAYKSLEKIQEQHFNIAIQGILDSNRDLIDSSFRSYMMHYGFANKGSSIIKEKYIDLEKPFFGLIESCFNGMEYNEACKKIDIAINQISDCLSAMVNLNTSNKELLSE